MSVEKDNWDKFEIVAKALIPVAVGLMLLAWNNQRTTQQTSASMTQIATSVLSTEIREGDEPLRDWAISVLQNPSDPPVLTEAAAIQLRTTPIAWDLELFRHLDRDQDGLILEGHPRTEDGEILVAPEIIVIETPAAERSTPEE